MSDLPGLLELDHILNRLPVAVFRLDREARYLYVNRRFCDSLGRSAVEVLGRGPEAAGFPADLVRQFRDMAAKVFETGQAVEHEFVVQLPTRRERVLALLTPEPSADGGVASVLGIATDITRLQAIEDALRASEARFQAFMANTPINAWIKDSAGQYVFVNPATERHFARPAREWLGRTDADLFPAEVAGLLRENDLIVLRTGRPLEAVESATDPDGTTRNWLAVKFPFTDSLGRLSVGGVALDLTERHQLEQFRRESGKLLQAQKLESLGVLAGGIAHDFNNLLTGVLGNAGLARAQRDDPAAVDECLTNIEEAALRAAGLCQQMLAYAGRGQYTTQVTDLNLLASEMIQLLMAAVSKRANLRFNMGSNLPLVRCDSAQVRQVIMNLVTNASDAIGDRGGAITVTTGVTDADRKQAAELCDASGAAVGPGRYVYLEVADTGCGMADDVRARIFDPFFTTKAAGRGLGLAAVQGIVRGHRGAIKVASKPGIGSTFTVYLPAAEDRPATPADAPGAPVGRARRLLVIEDEENVRTFARKVLERAGFVVETAADGRAGVEAFRARPHEFAAVVLGLTMPGLDGPAVCRELRRLRADVKAILMSGFEAEDATARFAGLGLAGFVAKPFRVQDLVQAVTAVVGP